MEDVVIIGAGVMGCASALALAERGISALVLERSVPGAEASSAAAGILGAQVEAHADGPLARLCLASRERFGKLTSTLQQLTGIDVGYRPCGVTAVGFSPEDLGRLERETSWQQSAGLPLQRLDALGAREAEPSLSERVLGGVRFPGDARIDPPLLLRALRIAAELAGARFHSGSLVRRVLTEGSPRRAVGVVMEDGTRHLAPHVVLAAGSWSALVEGTELPPSAVRPARGQIVELQVPLPFLRGVVYGPGCYLSPRDDGRVLVGSTLEFVGFKSGVTAGAVRDLLSAAISLFPQLAEASVQRTWSNFRPYTSSELPLLGPSPIEGLVLATGHYRNGILLSAITGEVVASAITGSSSPLDQLSGLGSSRL